MTDSSIPNEQLIEVIRRLVPTAKEVAIVEFLPGGWTNLNYRVLVDNQPMVLRYSHASHQDPSSERKYFQTPSSPRLVQYDDTTRHTLTEWLEGQILEFEQVTPKQAARYLLDLHATIPTKVRKYDPIQTVLELLNHANASPEFSERLLDLHWEPVHIVGCHNDLNPYNMLRTSNGVIRTLDWETAGDNDPAFDIVGLAYGKDYSDAELEDLTKLYFCSDKLLEFVYLTKQVYVAREHAWALDQINRGNGTPDIEKQVVDSNAEFERLGRR